MRLPEHFFNGLQLRLRYNALLKAKIGFWKKSREESLKPLPGTLLYETRFETVDFRGPPGGVAIYEINKLVGNKFPHYV